MKVSICMITYNHAKYIAQAIESVLMQETSFDYELVIGEDCSTDTTRQIIVDYQKKYPEKIKALLPASNLGITKNFLNTLNTCTGEYIAMLEGDDFWTSHLKLQKQIDYLESNPDVMGCFHDAVNVDGENNIIKKQYYQPSQTVYNQEDALMILRSDYATCSLVFRAAVLQQLPEWFTSMPRDFSLDLLITEYGELHYIPENMSAYRIHSGGVWQGSALAQKLEEVVNRYMILLKNRKIAQTYGSHIKDIISATSYELVCFHSSVLSSSARHQYMQLFLRYSRPSFATYKIYLLDMLFAKPYNYCKAFFKRESLSR